ncbi:MAG: class I SAM-dependent methyltransferase [Methylococcaceae bacterium]|nr:class I SAM-dependent methyltransferase [Methylococcaceae bacterium]
MRALRDNKTEAVARLIKREINRNVKDLLVVGCGTGVEAAILAECLGADVTGIDIADNFHPQAADKANLQIGDATALVFEDASFDFVYSYHSLEHMNDPALALQEIKRVLTSDGSYWIGTPNRHRLLGYLGSKDATIGEKIKWNLIDLKARLQGKFRNEFGAHAGFSENELCSMLQGVFSETKCVTNIYFHEIYGRYSKILAFLETARLSKIAYPSVYFMGKK